jgi:uncharacterized protein (DUF2062 family)
MKINKFKEKIVRQTKDILKSNNSPESIALGFALGTLIAILPTPGFGVFIALFIALFFKKMSKLAILVSFTFWNPIIVAPLYWLSYELGGLFFTPNPSIQFDLAIFDQLYHYSGKFILGNAMIAFLISPLSYLTVYLLVVKYLRKKEMEGLINIPVQNRKKST